MSGEADAMAMVADALDPSAFEAYTNDVYGWAYRLLGRHHDALDVVQDVFLRWRAQCDRASLERPRGWLRRVTLNLAIDLRRRRTPTTNVGEEAMQRRPIPSDADDRLDQEALRADIAGGLLRLSEVQRGVLVAKIYDGMTFAQIAEEFGLAVPTVKTHYMRAVRAMREQLRWRWAKEDTR